MIETMKQPCEPEHDFALIVDGVKALTQSVEDSLFEAGCDDGVETGVDFLRAKTYATITRSSANRREPRKV